MSTMQPQRLHGLARSYATPAIATTLSIVMSVLLVASMPAEAVEPPDPVKLHPIDSAHWQGRVGLADSRANAEQALVRVIDAGLLAPREPVHLGAAAVTGLEGQPTSDLRKVAFAVNGDEAGIVPCVKVAYTDPLGNDAEVMVTPLRGRNVEGHPDWHTYRFDGVLPPGTIRAIELGVDVEAEPPDPIRFLFDNIVVNDRIWTHAGDNGYRDTPAPEPA